MSIVNRLRCRVRDWLLAGHSRDEAEVNRLVIRSPDGKTAVHVTAENCQAQISLYADGNEAHLAVTPQLAILALGPGGDKPVVSAFADVKGKFFQVGGQIHPEGHGNEPDVALAGYANGGPSLMVTTAGGSTRHLKPKVADKTLRLETQL